MHSYISPIYFLKKALSFSITEAFFSALLSTLENLETGGSISSRSIPVSSLQICEEKFIQREYQKPLLDVTDIATAMQIEIKIRIHKSIMDRVHDFCSFDNFAPDGKEFYIVDFPFIENDYNFDFLLSLGDKCECLSPQHIREEMKRRIRSISKLYESLT